MNCTECKISSNCEGLPCPIDESKVDVSICNVCRNKIDSGRCSLYGKIEKKSCRRLDYEGSYFHSDIECPECAKRGNGHDGILIQDEFGLFCAVTECNFSQDY